jgi:hypothetical protein
VRNKIKHRKKYKIGKSLTPLGKITIVLLHMQRGWFPFFSHHCPDYSILTQSFVKCSIYLYIFCLNRRYIESNTGHDPPNWSDLNYINLTSICYLGHYRYSAQSCTEKDTRNILSGLNCVPKFNMPLNWWIQRQGICFWERTMLYLE